MTTSQSPRVHVRPGEITSSLAVALNKLAEAGGLDVRTYWSKDADGSSHRVAVTEAMWDASDTHKSLIIVMANGEEFEFVCMPSSPALRAARRELEKAAHDAEKEV